MWRGSAALAGPLVAMVDVDKSVMPIGKVQSGGGPGTSDINNHARDPACRPNAGVVCRLPRSQQGGSLHAGDVGWPPEGTILDVPMHPNQVSARTVMREPMLGGVHHRGLDPIAPLAHQGEDGADEGAFFYTRGAGCCSR